MSDGTGALDDARGTVNPQTDVLSEETFLAQDVQHPEWAPGPFRADPGMTFRLDGQWDDPEGIGWTSESIFNPTVIEAGDGLHVLYRASPRKESLASRIGHAVLIDGVWRDDPANPVVWGSAPGEELGVEDPKILRGPDGYVLFYNAIFRVDDAMRAEHPSPGYPVIDVGCDISVATSTDLTRWVKRGPITDRAQTRLWAKGAVIPRDEHGAAVTVGGQYLMYISEGFDGVLHVGRSRDLLHWTFEPVDYLDTASRGLHLHEVATATVVGEHLVLDYFSSDADGWRADRTEYALDAPLTPLRHAAGGTLAWGGMVRSQGRWVFAQGWDAAPGARELLFYRTPEA
jgi:beta-1,2-mannosidase